MSKNLVVCCDGTSNEFGVNNTNVVRMVQLLDRDPALQRMYYDPGVGTMPEPGWITWAGELISDVAGLAFGAGLDWKVQEAYCFLMNLWEPGDRVFLFGFSRGAYTVRVLAALLHELGLIGRGNDNLVPYAIRLFKTAMEDHPHGFEPKDNSGYWELRDDFRKTFGRITREGDNERRFPVHFMGLWDTVSSVGWVWDPPKYPFTTHNPSVSIIRHAVSVDERRWFFRQNLVQQSLPDPISMPATQDLKQWWFPGVHCDVGGGYPANASGLWRLSLEWILAEAKLAGLSVNEDRRKEMLEPDTSQRISWTDYQTESLHGVWWLLEYFPKLCWNEQTRKKTINVGAGRHRTIAAGQLIAPSTLLRIRESSYTPPNMSANFLNAVRALPEVNGPIPYAP